MGGRTQPAARRRRSPCNGRQPPMPDEFAAHEAAATGKVTGAHRAQAGPTAQPSWCSANYRKRKCWWRCLLNCRRCVTASCRVCRRRLTRGGRLRRRRLSICSFHPSFSSTPSLLGSFVGIVNTCDQTLQQKGAADGCSHHGNGPAVEVGGQFCAAQSNCKPVAGIPSNPVVASGWHAGGGDGWRHELIMQVEVMGGGTSSVCSKETTCDVLGDGLRCGTGPAESTVL